MSFYRGPRITTNGLVLAVDAADNNSYPKSGTTSYDISSTTGVGTLTNGPTYTQENGGAFVLDGTNDYIVHPSTTYSLTNGGAMEMWLRLAAVGSAQGFFQINNTGAGSYINLYTSSNTMRWEVAGVAANGNYTQIFSSITLSANTWYHVVGTFNAAGATLYINNNVVATSNATNHPTTITSSPRVGDYAGYMNGRIAVYKFYNRMLGSSEVSQNFNALRGRFGI